MERGDTVWVFGEIGQSPKPDLATGTLVWSDDAPEPLMAFDSLADLFGAWDHAEPTLDIHVYLEGWAAPPWEWPGDDPEHVMEDKTDARPTDPV
ncbi:MAG: hypothetical protein WBG86_17920 [Polyangiales bacterium]